VTTATGALQRLDEAVAEGSIDELCVRRGARPLAVFGSAARGTALPGSDLDLAVEWLDEGDLLGEWRDTAKLRRLDLGRMAG
jgi:predicted nucleotidyltransferase